jgi:AcrR family transcriptional regulator
MMTDIHVMPAEATAPSRRERRKAETRRRLLDAARELFVERGFDATRPQDVARLADVGSGTFYVHFADKREAFCAVTEQAADELMQCMGERAQAAGDFEGRLRSALDALLEYSESHPGVVRACFADEAVISSGRATGASLRDRLARTLAQSLREAMLEGRVQRDYDPLVISYGVVGFIHQAFLHGASARLGRGHLIENVIRFCGRALAPV